MRRLRVRIVAGRCCDIDQVSIYFCLFFSSFLFLLCVSFFFFVTDTAVSYRHTHIHTRRNRNKTFWPCIVSQRVRDIGLCVSKSDKETGTSCASESGARLSYYKNYAYIYIYIVPSRPSPRAPRARAECRDRIATCVGFFVAANSTPV